MIAALILIGAALLAVPAALVGHWIGFKLAERYYRNRPL